jgi:hypothetical protein
MTKCTKPRNLKLRYIHIWYISEIIIIRAPIHFKLINIVIWDLNKGRRFNKIDVILNRIGKLKLRRRGYNYLYNISNFIRFRLVTKQNLLIRHTVIYYLLYQISRYKPYPSNKSNLLKILINIYCLPPYYFVLIFLFLFSSHFIAFWIT